MHMSIFSFTRPPSPPLPPGTCTHCKGKRRIHEECKTCGGAGYTSISLESGETLSHPYACHDCANFRCHKCGGEGRTPTPRLPSNA
jgi:RecJ-like exonuclease